MCIEFIKCIAIQEHEKYFCAQNNELNFQLFVYNVVANVINHGLAFVPTNM
jgi:hypothetical protein